MTGAAGLHIIVSMRGKLPPWVGKTGDLSDPAHLRAMTPDERLEGFVEVCELARTILEERPDRAAVLERVDAMPPEAERRWRELVAQARRARSAR